MENEIHAVSGSTEPSLNQLLDQIEQCLQPIATDALTDDVAERLNRIEVAYRRIADCKKLFGEAFAEWLVQNGDLVIGEVRWYAGIERTWHCRDKPAAIDLLLDIVGGDLAGLCEYLAADPLKHGSCRKSLKPEDFERLFYSKERASPKPGKPKAIRSQSR